MEQVRIEGLRELRRTIRQIGDTELKDGMKNAHKRAADLVAKDAASRAPVKTGALKESIKSLGSQREAKVKGGKKKVPYFGFIDFGGTIKQTNRTISRPYMREGRMLYPALAAKRRQIAEEYSKEVETIFRSFGYRVGK